jgi:hypothetical protein
VNPNNTPEASDIISPKCPHLPNISRTTIGANDVMFSRHYPWVEPEERRLHGIYVLQHKFWTPEENPEEMRARIHAMPKKDLFWYAYSTSWHEWINAWKEQRQGYDDAEEFWERLPETQTAPDHAFQEYELQHDLSVVFGTSDLDDVLPLILNDLEARGNITEKQRAIYEKRVIQKCTRIEIARELKNNRSHITRVIQRVQAEILQYLQDELKML